MLDSVWAAVGDGEHATALLQHVRTEHSPQHVTHGAQHERVPGESALASLPLDPYSDVTVPLAEEEKRTRATNAHASGIAHFEGIALEIIDKL